MYDADVTTFSRGQQRMTTGAGWAHNAGQLAVGSDVAMTRKLTGLQNRELRQQVIQSLNNAPARQNAFSQWVGNVLTTRSPGNRVQPVGFIAEDIAAAIEARTGKPAARLLTISEKELVKADSLKRKSKGLALTLAESQALPHVVARPSAVLWDSQSQRLLYISNNADSTLKTVVSAPWQMARADTLDVAVMPQRVPLSALKKGMDIGQYELLQGAL
ncbi:hypothetical protein ACFFW8_11720 [Erwinia tracheiphila]